MARTPKTNSRKKAFRTYHIYAEAKTCPPEVIDFGCAIIHAMEKTAHISGLYVQFWGHASQIEIEEPVFIVNDYVRDSTWADNFNNRNVADLTQKQAKHDGCELSEEHADFPSLMVPVAYLPTEAQRNLADKVADGLEKKLLNWLGLLEPCKPLSNRTGEFGVLPDRIKYSGTPVLYACKTWHVREDYEPAYHEHNSGVLRANLPH